MLCKGVAHVVVIATRLTEHVYHADRRWKVMVRGFKGTNGFPYEDTEFKQYLSGNAWYKTYHLTPWSRILLQNLIVVQLVKTNSSTSLETRMFIIVLIKAHNWSPSWIKINHLTLPQHTLSLSIYCYTPIYTSSWSILILYSHLH
jgi:hypothetical protein